MDIALDANGDLDTSDNALHLVEGDDALVQHCQIRLRFFRGEWFLNTEIGVPYFEKILVKNPDLVIINSIYRRVVLTQPGIQALDEFELVFDRGARELTVSFIARKEDGAQLVFEEFIIQ